VDKPKAAPKDLTLLDEFEKNVETVIGILENSVSIIDHWIKDLPKSARTGGRFIPQRTTNDVVSMLHSFYPFADLFPEIQRFLTTHVPQSERRVDKRYSDINEKIEEIVSKCGQDPRNPPPNPAIPYREMTELMRYIENLVEDLRFCVKKAREKLAAEKWYQNRTIQATLIGAVVLILLSLIGWFVVPYISIRMKPVDNPKMQAPRMPQTPHRSSVKPTQIIKEPVKVRKPQLIGGVVNEPNKGLVGDVVNEPNKGGVK